MSVPDCFRFLSFTINILLKFLFVSTFYWMLKVVGFFCYIKFVHVIWQFHPRMKVRYFLMNQIYDLKTLEGLNMIWRLAQDLDQPEFWPCGRLKGPKITNEALKISYFRHYIHVRKSPNDMDKSISTKPTN